MKRATRGFRCCRARYGIILLGVTIVCAILAALVYSSTRTKSISRQTNGSTFTVETEWVELSQGILGFTKGYTKSAFSLEVGDISIKLQYDTRGIFDKSLVNNVNECVQYISVLNSHGPRGKWYSYQASCSTGTLCSWVCADFEDIPCGLTSDTMAVFRILNAENIQFRSSESFGLNWAWLRSLERRAWPWEKRSYLANERRYLDEIAKRITSSIGR